MYVSEPNARRRLRWLTASSVGHENTVNEEIVKKN